MIIIQRAKLSTRSITHLCWSGAIEGHFEGKTPRCGKVTKEVLFLHDNAPAHRALATHKKLASLGFQCLDHPPYSPDLVPLDYHVFPWLRKQLKDRHISSNVEVIAAVEAWLNEKPSKFFLKLLAEVRAKGYKVYWASQGVGWINPEFGCWSLFPSWLG